MALVKRSQRWIIFYGGCPEVLRRNENCSELYSGSSNVRCNFIASQPLHADIYNVRRLVNESKFAVRSWWSVFSKHFGN